MNQNSRQMQQKEIDKANKAERTEAAEKVKANYKWTWIADAQVPPLKTELARLSI